MDSNLQNLEEQQQFPEPKSEEQQQQLTIVQSQPFAAVSLSVSTFLPNFVKQPKNSALLSSPTTVKIPTQVASLAHLPLAHLSLSATSSSRTNHFLKSTISANPLHNPLSLGPRRPADPSNGAIVRRATIVWFRNDLRVHDNECLTTASNESVSVLPVYCFDPRDYGKSSSGFDKTGPYRASFLIESVTDLRKNLQARGSDLVVRVGKPENVLRELAKAIGADAVFAHKEVSHDEVKAEEKIENIMKDEGVEVKYFWGSTLYHVDDLPFKMEDMPTNYGGFREKLQGLEIRQTIAALEQIKGLPSRGDVEPGDIPSLLDLGLNSPQGPKPTANASMVGGETEALQRLKKFAAECRAQPPKGTNGGHDSIYGANFSCKISPWLTLGCISPRSMFDELKKTATRAISAASKHSGGGSGSPENGLNWLMFELLWRDFFRFITKKYSSSSKQVEAAPATACMGAFA